MTSAIASVKSCSSHVRRRDAISGTRVPWLHRFAYYPQRFHGRLSASSMTFGRASHGSSLLRFFSWTLARRWWQRRLARGHARHGRDRIPVLCGSGEHQLERDRVGRGGISCGDSTPRLRWTPSMQHLVSSSMARPRYNAALVGLLAVVASGLAALGVYGVMGTRFRSVRPKSESAWLSEHGQATSCGWFSSKVG